MFGPLAVYKFIAQHPVERQMLPSRCRTTLRGHNGPVFVVRYDKRGEYCMSAGQDRKIYLWNPGQSAVSTDVPLIQTYSGHAWEVFDLTIARDSTTFASCGGDRQAFLWDTATGRIVRKFQGHHQRLNSVAFNEEATVLASGSDDRSVRLWDCRSSSRFPIQILEDARDAVSSLSVRMAMIAAASIDGCVRLYDLRRGRLNVDDLHEAVTSVRLGEDSQCHLASVSDSTVRLLDGPSGTLLNTFRGHVQQKYRTEAVFSHDEAHVLSGSEDSVIYAWDLVSGRTVRTLAGHGGPVTSLASHPSKPLLLSASTDGTIKVWE